MPELTEELLSGATPAELEQYELLLRRELATRSPLDLAEMIMPETKRWPHIEYLNERLVALCEYRLYPSGPGPLPRWFYVPVGEKEAVEVETYEDIPERVDEFYGKSPVSEERVVFRLAIAAPPRHGKSYLITESFPIWYLLRWPDRDVAFATYSDDFAQEWGVKLRDSFVDNETLLGFELKGGRSSAAARLRMSKGGTLRLVGTGGALSGTGYQLGIIDDPFKDYAEALSQATRNAKANWYTSTFASRKTRVHGGGIPVEVMMFTRWHEDDIAGRFTMDENGDPFPDWHVVRLPALAEDEDPLGRTEGEALCPAVKTRAELLAVQAEDPAWFAALYQGNPSQDATGVFGDFSFYTTSRVNGKWTYHMSPNDENHEPYRIDPEDCVRFATVDLAASKQSWADWSVYALWDWHRETQDLILVKRFRDKVESSEHEKWLRNAYNGSGEVAFVGIENKTFGQTLVQTMIRNGGMTVRPLKADKDKVSRAIPYGQAAKNGQVWLPKQAEWLANWMMEHRSFPSSGTHDDQVDCGAYAWNIALSMPVHNYSPKFEPVTLEDKVEAFVERKIKRRSSMNRRSGIMSGRIGY